VIDGPEDELDLVVPARKQAFVEQLRAIKCIAVAYQAGLAPLRQA
jgi:hypothetical protein